MSNKQSQKEFLKEIPLMIIPSRTGNQPYKGEKNYVNKNNYDSHFIRFLFTPV